jgi:hypothetical protein
VVGALARRVEKLAGRRWPPGRSTALAGGCSAPTAEEAEEQSRAPEEEEERGGGSEGSVCKNRKVQGLYCKVKFPTDPKS